MKKFSFLFVVMALAMFAFVFAASAQTELPAIDEKEAAPYLGTWYMDRMCFGKDCMDLSGLGMVSTLTFNTDNTAVMKAEDSNETMSWYMKDGTALVLSQDGEGKTQETPLSIDKNGSLIMGDEEGSVYFVREIAPTPGTGALKADATYEDFSGEWFLNGIMFDGEIMPASMIGMSGSLVIREDTMDVNFEGEEPEENVSYTLADGKITMTDKSTDENGAEVEATIILEYHEDNSILLQMEGEGENMYLVYVRKEALTTGPSMFDLMGGFMDEGIEGLSDEAEMSDEELEAAFAELFAELEAEGALEENSNFDLSALLSELNVEGLLENVNLDELKSQFTNENGDLDLSSVLDNTNVQGLLSGIFGDENGEGSVDLSGMLQGLFGSEGK